MKNEYYKVYRIDYTEIWDVSKEKEEIEFLLKYFGVEKYENHFYADAYNIEEVFNKVGSQFPFRLLQKLLVAVKPPYRKLEGKVEVCKWKRMYPIYDNNGQMI